MRLLAEVLAVVAVVVVIAGVIAQADIHTCPSDSPCGVACSDKCTGWTCIRIPLGNHYASAEDRVALTAAGYDGVLTTTTLAYRLVFHNDTTNYPTTAVTRVCTKKLCDDPYCPCVHWETRNTSLATNENKLMGFTRGIVPVMDKSCMFSWRRTLPDHGEPAGMLRVFGYGWRNKHMPPWKYPEQNPDMGLVRAEYPYVFRVTKTDTECLYSINDGYSGALVANATTPQEPGGLADGVKFALYFGGEVAATQGVTVSYTTDVACTA